jgi:hypothetical protein
LIVARRNDKMLKIVIWVVVVMMVLTMIAALAPVFT